MTNEEGSDQIWAFLLLDRTGHQRTRITLTDDPITENLSNSTLATGQQRRYAVETKPCLHLVVESSHQHLACNRDKSAREIASY